MTIAQQLLDLDQCKQDIKTAIEAKGVTVGSVPFSDYDTKIGLITGGGSCDPVPTPWVRPSEWTAMPSVSSSENKIVMLVAVGYGNTSSIAFSVTTSTGTYTIDWGDGTTNTAATSTTTFSYNYDYDDADLGSVTSYGYKLAMITITPNTGNITGFAIKQPTISAVNAGYNNILDFVISAPSLTSFTLNVSNTTYLPMLERVRILSWANNISGNAMFQNCRALQVVELPSDAIITVGTNMFQNCVLLQEIPSMTVNLGTTGHLDNMFINCNNLIKFNTFTVTASNNTRSANAVFQSCINLYRAPTLDYSIFSNTGSMFQSCTSLQILSDVNLTNATSVSSMFNGCSSLSVLPNITFPSGVVSYANMFQGCNFSTIPNWDLSNAQSLLGCFSSNKRLTTFPSITLNGSGSSLQSMFNGSSSLRTIGTITGTITNGASLFTGCTNLLDIPALSTGGLTGFGVSTANIIFGCVSLRTIGAVNCSGMTGSTGQPTFTQCPNLERSQVIGMKFTHSYAGCNLSAAALNEIYTNLATVTGQTITVTGNPGTTSDDPTIATAKGWTVTG